jgi:hypothetical protein
MQASSYDEAVCSSTKPTGVSDSTVLRATQNSATCCGELHCSPLKHPGELFPSVYASVSLSWLFLIIQVTRACFQASAPAAIFLSDTVIVTAYFPILYVSDIWGFHGGLAED